MLALVAVTGSACAHSAPLPPKAIALNRDGAAALAAGDLETAEARIALALEYNPRFTEAWVNLGLVEMQAGNFARARVDFVKARDLNPDLPAPHHALGLLADREDRGAEAERYYRAALKVDPGFAPARINLARRLFARGALEEAREHLLRLTQVAPDWPEGWADLCDVLMRLGRVDDAEDVLTVARSRLGVEPSLELVAARLLLRRGDFTQAERRLLPLTRSVDVHRAAPALAWLAIAKLGRGDVTGAMTAAAHAAELEPDDDVVRYALRTARTAESEGQNAAVGTGVTRVTGEMDEKTRNRASAPPNGR